MGGIRSRAWPMPLLLSTAPPLTAFPALNREGDGKRRLFLRLSPESFRGLRMGEGRTVRFLSGARAGAAVGPGINPGRAEGVGENGRGDIRAAFVPTCSSILPRRFPALCRDPRVGRHGRLGELKPPEPRPAVGPGTRTGSEEREKGSGRYFSSVPTPTQARMVSAIQRKVFSLALGNRNPPKDIPAKCGTARMPPMVSALGVISP